MIRMRLVATTAVLVAAVALPSPSASASHWPPATKLGGTTTTANALGTAPVTHGFLFCPDATGPAYW